LWSLLWLLADVMLLLLPVLALLLLLLESLQPVLVLLLELPVVEVLVELLLELLAVLLFCGLKKPDIDSWPGVGIVGKNFHSSCLSPLPANARVFVSFSCLKRDPSRWW
jgi:hypothetical protein